MSDSPEPTAPPRLSRRSRVIGGTVVVAVVLIAVILSLTLIRPETTSTSASEAAGSASASPTATGASPAASASPEPSVAPSAAPPGGQPAPVSTPIDAPADGVGGVSVRIERLEAVQGEARGPGEIAGPAIRFAVVVTNPTGAAVALSTVVVNLDYGADRTPGGEIAAPGGVPLPPAVAAGAAVEGTYLFTVPADARDLVTITVDSAVDIAPVQFSGPAPR